MLTTERHYKITFPDDSTYYGRTTLPSGERYAVHLAQVKKGKHDNKHIQEVYNKYGSDDWVHEWLGTEIGNKQHHDKIEYSYVLSDPKALNIDNGHCSLDNKEYHRQYNKKRYQEREWTPEYHKEYNRRARERYHKLKQKNEII